MKNKTIFLVINQGFTARYLLRSDIFKILKDSGINIVILSQSSHEEYFQDEFSGENVFHEQYKQEKYRNKNHRLVLFFTLARLYSFKTWNNFTNYWKGQYFSNRKNSGLFKKITDSFLKVTIFILSNSRTARRLYIDIESRLTWSIHQELFEKYKPNIVVTTSLGMLPYDRFIMHEANRNGAKCVPLVLSWDNTTTKGIAGAKSDYVVAWTEIMKRELVEYHDIPPEKVFVGGVVQYEEYFKDVNLYSREKLFKMLDLDPDKKTIFYCLESPTAYKWNPALIEMMADMIQMGKIPKSCQLVIRPHPIYYRIENGRQVYEKDIQLLKELEERYPFIRFDHPMALSTRLSHDMPVTEVYKLGSLLKHSDVVICFYSSINIEASIFDTPIINIELYHKRNLPNQVMANHAHNKRVLATGGVRSVKSESELEAAINAYLENPKLDSNGRQTIVNQEAGPNRGQAASKIANYLVELVNS